MNDAAAGGDCSWLPHFELAIACACCAFCAPALARDVDLTVYRNGKTFVTPTLDFQTAYFVGSGAWAGASDEILGAPVDDWAEWSLEPGLEGELDLGQHGNMYARLSGVGSWTRVGLDAAGSNFDDRRPEAFLLEDAYLGWRSGDWLPSLGKDAIDLSLGAQDYRVGDGFLWWNGGSDGGGRGAFWISPNTAFALTGIARLATGPFAGELLWLMPNDAPDSHTRIVGANSDYAIGTLASIGLGYWYFYQSDEERRDGLHVIDLRGWLAPIPAHPDFLLSGEIAHEKNGRQNDSWGGWVEAAYTHQPWAWQPQLSYRFSLFTGDDQGDDANQAFDPLFYSASNWGDWEQGELFGQYVSTNQNLIAHRLHASIQPLRSLTLSLLYYHFRIQQQAASLVSSWTAHAGNVESGSFGNEVDLTADWAANSHLSFSTVLAIFQPTGGGKDFFGDDETWVGFMLYATLRF
jgi:hypothetical protein